MPERDNPNPGFRITEGRGFHSTYATGWSISVQFGCFHYCSNKNNDLILNSRLGDPMKPDRDAAEKGSATAEIALITPDSNLLNVGAWGDSVKGYCSPEEVLYYMNIAASGGGWRWVWIKWSHKLRAKWHALKWDIKRWRQS